MQGEARRRDPRLRLRLRLLRLRGFEHLERSAGAALVQRMQPRELGRGGVFHGIAAALASAQIGDQCGRIQHQAQCFDAFRRLRRERMRDDDADRALLFGVQAGCADWLPATGALSSSSPSASTKWPSSTPQASRQQASRSGLQDPAPETSDGMDCSERNFWARQRCVQHVLEVIARALQLGAHLEHFEFGAHGENFRADLILNVGTRPGAGTDRPFVLAPRRVQLPLGRVGACAGNVLGTLRRRDLAVNARLQREHALPGQFAAGARLGDLAAVAIQRQRESHIEGKLGDAVIPVVSRREHELRILAGDRLLQFRFRGVVLADCLPKIGARQQRLLARLLPRASSTDGGSPHSGQLSRPSSACGGRPSALAAATCAASAAARNSACCCST
jgi:hypothetical protein